MGDSTGILCTWNGEAFEPAGASWVRRANERMTVGERYFLEVQEIRSAASHRHYFAAVNEAFKNLPESLHDRFATADHLRRWALIKTGFRDERSIVCASKAEAQRVAAFIRPIDSYAVVVVRDAVVIEWVAKSQSQKAMGRVEFQRSKDSVLDCIAELISTTPDTLKSTEAA